MSPTLPIVLECDDRVAPKVRYVFDTLLMAAGIGARFVAEPPAAGPWLLYAPSRQWRDKPVVGGVAIAHCPDAWSLFTEQRDAAASTTVEGLAAVFAQRQAGFDANSDVGFDIVANAFYFLSSWSERLQARRGSRQLFADSVSSRLGTPQDIVDHYLERLVDRLQRLNSRLGLPAWPAPTWPTGAAYAVLLSHDVDFLPGGAADIAWQGLKTALRHLVRQRAPLDAWRATSRLGRACLAGVDPYGCVPEIIEREARMGVCSSFQVAVARRHPHDVNYSIDDDDTRDYLRTIVDSGFELCLHGSYRSTEDAQWYRDEVALLTRRLGRPIGSRQHFLSFDYDTLFTAQEQSGIAYDMSMGFPDRIGPRNGFSFPYFPYSLDDDRPYDVLQISLGLMDVTLRAYMGLSPARALPIVEEALADLSRKRGCTSLVWHPIVFGGARDPGYDELYWQIVDHVRASGGLATDGRTINAHWRQLSQSYASFGRFARSTDDCVPVSRLPAHASTPMESR
jgi:hypothetical protein